MLAPLTQEQQGSSLFAQGGAAKVSMSLSGRIRSTLVSLLAKVSLLNLQGIAHHYPVNVEAEAFAKSEGSQRLTEASSQAVMADYEGSRKFCSIL